MDARSSSLLSIALFASALAAPAWTQQAGEAAKKAQPKDKKTAPSPPPAKAYTDDDLKKYRPGPPPEDKPATGSKAPGQVGGTAGRPSPSPIAPTPPAGVGEGQRVGEGGEVVAPEESGDASVPEGSTAPPPEAATEGDTGDGGAAEQEWNARAQQARATLRQAESNVERLQRRLAALRNDTGMERLGDPFRLQSIQAEIGQLATELEQAKTQLQEARKALGDLEEEARRANVPPGWLRERPDGPGS